MANEVTIIVKSRDQSKLKEIGEKAGASLREGVQGGLDDAEKATEKHAPKIGDEAGQSIGEHTRTSMRQPLSDGLNETEKKFKQRFYEIGDHSGRTLTEKLDEHLDHWSQHFEKIDVTIEERFRQVGEHGGKGLGDGLGGAVESVTKLGRRAGDNAGSGFLGALGDVAGKVKSAWIPMLIAALIPQMPAIGALAATALVFAFGAGLAALGLVAAFHLKSVQREFTAFKKFAGGWAKDISKPFEATWATIFNVAGNVMKRLGPTLKGAFKDFLAPAVTNFVLRLGDAFTRLEPAIRPVSEAFGKMLDSIGDRLPDIFGDIADAFASMATTISDNPDLFAGFITGLFQIVAGTLKVIDFLSKLFEVFSRFEHTSNPFTLMLAALSPLLAILLHLGVAGKVFHAIGDAAKTIGPKVGDLFDKIKDKAGPILKDIGGQIKNELVPAFTDFLHSAAPLAGKLLEIFTPSVVANVKDILHAVSGLLDLLSGFLKISSGLLSGDWSKMWDGMKDVAKGAAKEIGVLVKGLLDMLTLGHGDKAIKIALDAKDHASDVISKVVGLAKRFGHGLYRAKLTAKETVTGVAHVAEAVAKRFARGVYRAKLTAKETASGVAHVAQAVCKRFASGSYRAVLSARNAVASALRSAIGMGLSWARRVFTATFNVRRIIGDINPFNAHGGIIGGLATGGMPRGQAGGGPGGSLTWVGEQGAELVRLPTGSQVYPAGQSKGMAARAGGGGDAVRLEVVGGAQDEFTKLIVFLIRNFVRVTKGSGPNSVQGALGGV